MDWQSGLAIAAAIALGPLFAKLIQKDKEREEREIDEWEQEQAEKRARKLAKKQKLLAPPLPLVSRDDSGPGSDSAGTGEPR